MTSEQAEKLKADWLRKGEGMTCSHRLLEMVNGNIPAVYVCVQCGDPAIINPLEKK